MDLNATDKPLKRVSQKVKDEDELLKLKKEDFGGMSPLSPRDKRTPMFRLCFVGASAVGKSSLVQRIFSEKQKFDEEYSPTDDTSVLSARMMVEDVYVEVELVDTYAGEKDWFGKDPHGLVLLFALDDERTFRTLKDVLIPQVIQQAGEHKAFASGNRRASKKIKGTLKDLPPFIVVGCKSDKVDRMDYDVGQDLADEMNCEYLEVSNKDNTNCREVCERLLRTIEEEQRALASGLVSPRHAQQAEEYVPSSSYDDKKEKCSLF